jgi:L-asparaginase/beta-aspartyl-peptidase (threonine type)
MSTTAIVTHGGAGAPNAHTDGAQRAADLASDALRAGASALEAAIQATMALEDDPRFNAGTGSNLRADGALIEMDAAVMTGDGRSGAVGCVRGVRHPVRVAEAVLDTPHLLVVGEGAERLARKIGLPPYDPTTDEAKLKLERAKARLAEGHRVGGWSAAELRERWNYDAAISESFGSTVGAVARAADGSFAVAASTGGTILMLLGRVGDTPLLGCGFYAGPAGAVAATGTGEEIVKRFLSKAVYDRLAAGDSAEQACAWGVAQLPAEVVVGVIAVGVDSAGSACNREMPVGRA